MTQAVPAPVHTKNLPVVIVPVYNHGASLRSVVTGVLQRYPHILVVDDGSTDLSGTGKIVWGEIQKGMLFPNAVYPPEHPLYGLPAGYIRHTENCGKGTALMSGAKEAAKVGATHIISIDADGQHDPADIPSFLAVIDENPLALLVGCRDFATENVPFSSRFGRTFSNFWFKVQTGEVLSDMQCGFRAYPLVVFERVACSETRYSFEIEILVRGVWAGFSVRDVPIRVYYPPREERISHFAAFWDNVRISWLNTRLTIRAIMPMPHRTYAVDKTGHISVLNPLQSLRILLIHNETPSKLACSAFLGVFLGTLPLYGMHSIR